MKKILLVAAMSVMLIGATVASAFAANGDAYNKSGDVLNKNTAVNEGTNGVVSTDSAPFVAGSVDVKAKVDVTGDTTHVYGLNYDKTSLEFTYTTTEGKYWNPNKLMYETQEDENGVWSTAQSVSVANYSDLAVNVAATYADGAGNEGDGVTVTIGNGTFALASAAPVGTANKGTKTENSFTVTPSGRPTNVLSTMTSIGTITINVTAAN